MQQVRLGHTGILVSKLCLGTMTWGSQNSQAQGHAQADRALEAGLNFWDTAEMYPVNPVLAETIGRTEEIIGAWFATRGGRDRVVLASKVCGGGRDIIRAGAPVTGVVLRAGVEASLRRLQTDYIDIFQLHWPDRKSYHFRDIWGFDARGGDRAQIDAQIIDILQVTAQLISEGKIRHLSLSNESVWGAARWLALSERHGLPRVMTVQNEYSLLCRQFDSDWAEMAVLEDMPLLAFSPLATGLLTGKYAGDVIPENSRRALNHNLSGRITPQVFPAVAAYLGIAARHGLDPAQMAIAFCAARPFPLIPIIGATTLAQLKTNIGAADVVLSDAVLVEIDAAHRAHPQPY